VGAKLIFDPFCGVGTIPAVANALGLDALGIELAKKRCEQSREQKVALIDL
jgi:tRNA G10  N-methylase Trm11